MRDTKLRQNTWTNLIKCNLNSNCAFKDGGWKLQKYHATMTYVGYPDNFHLRIHHWNKGEFPHHFTIHTEYNGERGGSVVECRTPEREVRGSRPTVAVSCPWARHFTPRKYWLITQEAMAPSRYDWKIVDWDVKPQHNQPTEYNFNVSWRDITRFAEWCRIVIPNNAPNSVSFQNYC